MITALVLVIFPMLVAFGGISDLLTMTIQNRVSILLVAGFMLLALASGLPLQDWWIHAIGFAILFVPCFIFFAAGWMGGGDVKFISAISLWIGYSPELLNFVFLVAIYGMVLTLGLLFIKRSSLVPLTLMRQEWLARLCDKDSGIPYGIAIAIAGLQIYPSTFWFAVNG